MTIIQKIYFFIAILLISLLIIFKDVITNKNIFATADTQSAAAIGIGMESHKSISGE